MRPRAIEDSDRADWLRMRCALWPDVPPDDLARAVAASLAPAPRGAVFVVPRTGGGLGGFVEVSLRDVAEGASSSPVGYVEAWYVDTDLRGRGLGRALVTAAEGWARAQGCTEMGSDADLENEASHRAHRALGYRETERLVTFLKPLG